MDKVGHLRFRQLQGEPFAWETWKSLTLKGSTMLRRTICEGNMK